MSTSGTELRDALAQSVSVSDDALVAELADGRTITVPLAWFPRLAHGTPAERANLRLIAGGEGIHWPDLDEDISVESLLAGRRSGETQESLRRWLQRLESAGSQGAALRSIPREIRLTSHMRPWGPVGWRTSARRAFIRPYAEFRIMPRKREGNRFGATMTALRGFACLT